MYTFILITALSLIFVNALLLNGLNLCVNQIKLKDMKGFYVPSLLVVALALTLSACEKTEENSKKLAVSPAATIADAVYPIVGTDTLNNILPGRKLPKARVRIGTGLEDVYPNIEVQVIDTICAEYLNGTQKVDLSNLAEGSVNHTIRFNGNVLTTDPDFTEGRFRKLSHGVNGWWTHWNYSPYTESEYPTVLFAQGRSTTDIFPKDEMSIAFKNEVRVFGFEIAPNKTGEDLEVVVTYSSKGADYRWPFLFEVSQTISSPSGARLIAVKSKYPFGYINIFVGGVRPYREGGFAIANIRYQP